MLNYYCCRRCRLLHYCNCSHCCGPWLLPSVVDSAHSSFGFELNHKPNVCPKLLTDRRNISSRLSSSHLNTIDSRRRHKHTCRCSCGPTFVPQRVTVVDHDTLLCGPPVCCAFPRVFLLHYWRKRSQAVVFHLRSRGEIHEASMIILSTAQSDCAVQARGLCFLCDIKTSLDVAAICWCASTVMHVYARFRWCCSYHCYLCCCLRCFCD